MKISLFFPLLFALFLCSCASQRKKPTIHISFHLETQKIDLQKTNHSFSFSIMRYGEKLFFERSAILAKKSIVGFSVFPGENNDYGAVFQLSETAGKRLKAISAANLGKQILLKLNGKNVNTIIIDKSLSSPFIAFWGNLTLQEINLLKETFPKIRKVRN